MRGSMARPTTHRKYIACSNAERVVNYWHHGLRLPRSNVTALMPVALTEHYVI